MNFWDASAVVTVLVAQPDWRPLATLLNDERPHLWWGTALECLSALARLERTGDIDPSAASAAKARLHEIEIKATEIEPSSPLRDRARRLVQTHPLRAADALQLAAALILADGDPASLGFVCLDRRLADAARREGFTVLP